MPHLSRVSQLSQPGPLSSVLDGILKLDVNYFRFHLEVAQPVCPPLHFLALLCGDLDWR